MEKKRPPNAKNTGMRRSPAPDRHTALRLVHAVLGSVLAVAGTIKLYELAFESRGQGPTSWLLMVYSEAEFLRRPLDGRRVAPLRSHPWAVAAFAGFAASSSVQALAGKCSCGCLGSLSVSPWSVLIFDLAAVALLMRCHPFVDPEAMSSEHPLRPHRARAHSVDHRRWGLATACSRHRGRDGDGGRSSLGRGHPHFQRSVWRHHLADNQRWELPSAVRPSRPLHRFETGRVTGRGTGTRGSGGNEEAGATIGGASQPTRFPRSCRRRVYG